MREHHNPPSGALPRAGLSRGRAFAAVLPAEPRLGNRSGCVSFAGSSAVTNRLPVRQRGVKIAFLDARLLAIVFLWELVSVTAPRVRHGVPVPARGTRPRSVGIWGCSCAPRQRSRRCWDERGTNVGRFSNINPLRALVPPAGKPGPKVFSRKNQIPRSCFSTCCA